MEQYHGTTILSVRRGNSVAMGGDGQVTLGNIVVKATARKVRRLDFISAGQLVNRLAPYQAAGRDIVIRSPNHLVAELMAVVGLNKQARIIVPKS